MAIPYESKPLPAVSTFPFDIGAWQGVNIIKGAQADGEMAECKNMCSDNFPYASPRKSREKLIDEAGIKRIYKVEGNRVYYIDADNYLCYGENGTKNYVTYKDENEVEQKIQIDECKCTNNYDENSIFFPEMAYTKKDNTIKPLYPSIYFSELPNNPTETQGNSSTHYRLSVTSQAFPIEDTSVKTLSVTMTLPKTKEYGYSVDYSPHISMNVYDSTGIKRSFNYGTATTSANATVTGQVNTYNFNLGETNKFDEGDYVIFELYCSAVDDDFKLSEWKSIMNYALTASWIVVNEPKVVSMGLDYGVVYNNRIVGVKGSEIRASALGDFTNFWEYADEAGNVSATGAYATDVGSSGDFTGICAYNNVLLLFKKDIVYEMYGSMPYTITELCNTGCIDNDSIVSIDGVLYWASPKGIVRYSGGVPNVISTQIDIKTEGMAKAGTDGRKYYVYDGHKTYVYDIYCKIWHTEDEKPVKMLYNHINDLYSIYDDGIYKLNSGNETVEWEFTTKDFTFSSKERKNLSKLWIRAEMPRQSRLEIYARQNGGEWSRVAVKTAEKDEMFDFKLRIKKCDSYTLKFKGKGDVRILDIHGKVIVGTSKHRSGASLNVYRK